MGQDAVTDVGLSLYDDYIGWTRCLLTLVTQRMSDIRAEMFLLQWEFDECKKQAFVIQYKYIVEDGNETLVLVEALWV